MCVSIPLKTGSVGKKITPLNRTDLRTFVRVNKAKVDRSTRLANTQVDQDQNKYISTLFPNTCFITNLSTSLGKTFFFFLRLI